jgi:hypothetical protein
MDPRDETVAGGELDEPLREEDVLREDLLDDRVEEGEGLPTGDDGA